MFMITIIQENTALMIMNTPSMKKSLTITNTKKIQNQEISGGYSSGYSPFYFVKTTYYLNENLLWFLH